MDLIVFEDEYSGGDEVETGLIRRKPLISMKEDDNNNNDDDKLYVAVGKNYSKNESLLSWAIQNSGGSTICVIHVHQPDQFIPILGKKHHWSSLDEKQVKKCRGIERQLMLKTLDQYLQTCRGFGVEAEKLYVEMESFEQGISQLINCHKVEKLVIGAASDDSYHANMKEPKSKKAVYVLMNAPASCDIWFICKGNLVRQREGVNTSFESETSSNLKSLSSTSQSDKYEGTSLELLDRDISYVSPSIGEAFSLVHPDSTSYYAELLTSPYSQQNHHHPPFSPLTAPQQNHHHHPFSPLTAPQQNHHHHPLSPPTAPQEKSFESLYVDELKKKILLEDNLKNVTEDRNRLREELRVAREKNLELESIVANFGLVVKDLEEGLISNIELLQIAQEERDALKIERDSVLQMAEELLSQSTEVVEAPKFFTTLTFGDIEEATNNFNQSQQLWEGESGSIYRGVLSCTQVIVKIWPPQGIHGPEDFRRQVEILSKFRHPNIITLIGVSPPDACALVYEYLPNGTLEDRLRCKDNTPALPWKTRVKIATELCSALIFLHSQAPLRVVHTTLTPSYIFLDSNFTCKISGFGFSRLIPHHEYPLNTVSESFYSESSRTSGYMDPEFLTTGEVTPMVDVYSFGMILLELLTGKPAFGGVIDELEDALNETDFGSLLDASAGDWPFVQAKQLATLALRCCAQNASGRPDLELDVWRSLESIRVSCGGSPSLLRRDEEHHQAPSYFICPIFQEVMKDPHIASDGYTYEAEALKGWLDAGHNTSPMTNLQLEHLTLVPNHALRSAIREWQDQV